MKRIISLCCIALIFVFSLAAPARAEEFESETFIDLLDYGGINGGTDYFFTSPAGGRSDISFNLPSYGSVYYVDLLFRYSGSAVSAMTAILGNSTFNLTILNLGNNVCRAYGNLSGASGSQLTFGFTNTSTSWIEFLKIDVSSIRVSRWDIQAYCDIVSSEYSNTIHYIPTDEVNHRMFSATSDFSDSWFICYVWSDDWKKYDYLDFQFMFECFDITSVTAMMGSTNVPLEVSYLDGTAIEGNTYYVSMRMDCTSLDLTSSDYPMITIMGRLDPGVINSIDFANCSGYVVVNDRNPVYYYFRNLISICKSGFNNVNSWITAQTSAIQSQFSNIKTWIDVQTTSIVNAIRGNTASGDEFQDEVQQELDELDQAQAVMDSVTKPAIEDIDVSVDQYVSQADIQVLASPMAVFFEGEIFSKVIIMSILLATVSYTLYGKK